MEAIKKIKIAALAVSLLIATAASPASALELIPFESVNQSPLMQNYGLPGVGNLWLLPARGTEAGVSLALSSNHAVDGNPRESIILDGETARFTFLARHALSSRLEIGVKIPYIRHGGGFLDGFIENYHSAFGFPQGGRDEAPRNRLLYRYRKDGGDKFLLDSSGSGIGDVALTAAVPLYRENGRTRNAATLNLSLELPTGESDEFRGSGSTDVSLWLNMATENAFSYGRWGYYGALGLLYLTEGDILPDQQKKWVGFGSLGAGWIPLHWLALKVQADAHTAFFGDSDLDEVAAAAVQFTAGGTIGFTENTVLDLGVSEDLTVKRSPDVTFYLTLRTRF